jgi:spermidine synthase
MERGAHGPCLSGLNWPVAADGSKMKRAVLLDQTTTVDGKTMTLHERDGVYVIRIDGAELMSSRHHASEERIAELACAHVRHKTPKARILIGGLGLGYTLRTALENVSSDASVMVAEIMPSVIKWNLVPEYKLGGDAMADPRVKIIEDDVANVLREHPGYFDAIILDIDNGTSAMSVEANRELYQMTGLGVARSALRGKGCLAIWSASADPIFAKLMSRCGFTVTTEKARAHPSGGGWHTLFIGRSY